ncbi:MAG TPA: DUF1236 domain-containing protein [Rhizomicrobium sp.]
MKRLWMTGLAAAGLLAGSSAMAQDQPPMPAPDQPPMSQEGPPPGQTETRTTTTTTWTVRPEERTAVHDYIVKERVRPERVTEDVTIGAPIPPDVELQPVPEQLYTEVPEARHYEYFDWNGRMVFVDPDSRKVVQIIE